jgi:hypothetical protein
MIGLPASGSISLDAPVKDDIRRPKPAAGMAAFLSTRRAGIVTVVKIHQPFARLPARSPEQPALAKSE